MIKLLLVDDEKGIIDSLKNFFQERGFTVYTSTSGEGALECVRKDKPDIIFLDVKMKGMDGLATLEKIKKMDKNAKIIMLTIFDDKEMIAKAKKLGADEYITKPFRVDYLEEVVMKKIQELMKGKEK